MIDSKIFAQSPLFKEISETDAVQIMQCLGGVEKKFAKNEAIYRVGDFITSIGIVLSGSVHILQNDVWGNSHIIQGVERGGFFAEVYACQKDVACLVDVVATEESQILFININKILNVCSSCCTFHQMLVRNLLNVIAQKNLHLIKKIEHISPKSIRERILSYLHFLVLKNKKHIFYIPFNRQQLADYLSVDRSALSAELSKMQKEGLIAYHKNSFSIKISTGLDKRF